MSRWTLFGRLARQIRGDCGFIVADSLDLFVEMNSSFAAKLRNSLDDQMTNRPIPGVHRIIADMTNDSFGGPEAIAIYGLGASQMHISALTSRAEGGC